jgi:hypothetical protein
MPRESGAARADDGDDLVDVVEREEQALEDVARAFALARSNLVPAW